MINKLIGSAVSLLVIVVAASLYINHVKTTAYDLGVKNTQDSYKKQSDLLEKEQKEKDKVVVKEDHKDEVKTTEVKTEIVYEIKKVTEYVDREVIVPATCDKFASDVVLVLHNRTNLINKAAR